MEGALMQRLLLQPNGRKALKNDGEKRRSELAFMVEQCGRRKLHCPTEEEISG